MTSGGRATSQTEREREFIDLTNNESGMVMAKNFHDIERREAEIGLNTRRTEQLALIQTPPLLQKLDGS